MFWIILVVIVFATLFPLLKKRSPSVAGHERLSRTGIVVAVLNGPNGKRKFVCKNIITDAGDIFYAQRGAEETPDNNFANLVLGSTATPNTSKTSTTSSITEINNTEKAPSSGYPKTNDDDADNGYGGENVVTWKYAYGKADFNAASITEGIIKKAAAGAGQPVLCHFAFPSSFEKTSNDTLSIFVNHKSEGQ